jgi:hypothetical protein
MHPAPIRTELIPATIVKATRSVLVLRLLAAVLAGILAIIGWKLGIVAVPIFLGLVSVIGIIGVARAGVGAIHVSPTGIKFRSGLRLEAIRWTDIDQFVEVVRPWGESLSVDRSAAGRMPIRYAMPAPSTSLLFHDPAYARDVARLRGWVGLHTKSATAPTRIGFGGRRSAWAGFVVLLLVIAPIDRPRGWYGGAQASAVPVACAALTTDMARLAGATEPEAGSHTRTTNVCTWKIPAGTLSVSYHLFSRSGLHSGSDRAAEDQAFQVTDDLNSGFLVIDGYRAGARYQIHAPGSALASEEQILMLSRAANVDITIQMNYEHIDDSTLAMLTAITNVSIAAVATH